MTELDREDYTWEHFYGDLAMTTPLTTQEVVEAFHETHMKDAPGLHPYDLMAWLRPVFRPSLNETWAIGVRRLILEVWRVAEIAGVSRARDTGSALRRLRHFLVEHFPGEAEDITTPAVDVAMRLLRERVPATLESTEEPEHPRLLKPLCWKEPPDGEAIACDRQRGHGGDCSWEVGRRLTRAEEMAGKLATALRLTQEYVGDEVLPRRPGWSWFDALTEYEGAPPWGLEVGQLYEYVGEDPPNRPGARYVIDSAPTTTMPWMLKDEHGDGHVRFPINDPAEFLYSGQWRRVNPETPPGDEPAPPSDLSRARDTDVLLRGICDEAGGGRIGIWVDRDTERYPDLGTPVVVSRARDTSAPPEGVVVCDNCGDPNPPIDTPSGRFCDAECCDAYDLGRPPPNPRPPLGDGWRTAFPDQYPEEGQMVEVWCGNPQGRTHHGQYRTDGLVPGVWSAWGLRYGWSTVRSWRAVEVVASEEAEPEGERHSHTVADGKGFVHTHVSGGTLHTHDPLEPSNTRVSRVTSVSQAAGYVGLEPAKGDHQHLVGTRWRNSQGPAVWEVVKVMDDDTLLQEYATVELVVRLPGQTGTGGSVPVPVLLEEQYGWQRVRQPVEPGQVYQHWNSRRRYVVRNITADQTVNLEPVAHDNPPRLDPVGDLQDPQLWTLVGAEAEPGIPHPADQPTKETPE